MKGAAVNVSPAVIASGLLALLSSMGALALEETPAVKVTPLIKTTSSWTGKPIAYPDGQAEITAMVIEIAPGAETGWHAHPVPSFAMVLEGTLEVTLKDAGTTGTIGANLEELKPDAMRVEEAVRNGMGPMPPYAGKLTEEQIKAVAAYVARAAGK